MATKAKTGRPSDYLPEVAADICSLLAYGESLRKVCERPGMPAKATVFRWLALHEEFRDQYAKATETRADAIFEEMFHIADTGTGTSFTAELKANDFVVAVVGGVAYTLGIKSVDSNTALTLAQAYTGPAASGLAWTPVPFGTMTAITAQLASQVTYAVRGFNLDKANWQQILTGTGNVTVNLPDGNSWTGPAWGGITTSIDGKLDKNKNLLDLMGVAEARKSLKLGTAATATVGTGANQIPDMGSFALAPGGGGASFRRLPGGDILQIGRLQTSASATLTGMLNVAFPNANYSIIAVAQDQQASITCAPLTGSTFAISAWSIGNTGALGSRVTTLVSWFAWGN